MIKKLYLPLVALMVLALSSCGKMGIETCVDLIVSLAK